MRDRNYSPEQEREDELRVLKSIYELTSRRPDLHHRKKPIANGIPQSPDESFNVSYLMRGWVERGLVHEVVGSNTPDPKDRSKLTLYYQANLSRASEIEALIAD